MKKILLVKTSSIGDVIHVFPVVEYLHRCFPDAQVDWIVEKGCSALLKAHSGLHRVIEIDTKKWRGSLLTRETWREIRAVCRVLRETDYDVVFDLQGNSKSALFTLLAKAKEKVGYGRHSVPELPNLLVTTKKVEVSSDQNIRLSYLKLVGCEQEISGCAALCLSEAEKTRLQEIVNTKAQVMVAFGSKWTNKQLKVETLQQWLEKISPLLKSSFLFIYGNAAEKAIAEQLAVYFPGSSAAGELSLPLWQALMAEMKFVIAMDSAALHLCGTTATPSFSVFGPSSAAVYKPLGIQHGHYQGSCPYKRDFIKRCPVLRSCATGACMKEITADQLYSAFTDWLAGRN